MDRIQQGLLSMRRIGGMKCAGVARAFADAQILYRLFVALGRDPITTQQIIP
jgi:hypothetical protein